MQCPDFMRPRRLVRHGFLIVLTAVTLTAGLKLGLVGSPIARSNVIPDSLVMSKSLDPAIDQTTSKATGTQTAVFAGGCFWGMEAVFEHLKGVSDVVSGFSGGSATTAHYETVSSGSTEHAESIKITYDPSQISYGQLLKVYFLVAHDPTQLNRQGPDWGTQYRSEIFFANSDQQRIAQAYIDQLNRAKVFSKPIVTQLAPLNGFYAAEDYHQNFIDRNPAYPYVVMNELPKLKYLRQTFPALYK